MRFTFKYVLPVLIILVGVVLYRHFLLAGDRPNVLLVSIDSLRPDHLGCYGYRRDTSPNIDALSRQGAIFLNAISTTSWTLPAHMSLFTSMDITVHGVSNDGFGLHSDIPTLAGILSKNGYQTAGFCSSPYLNPAFGFNRGFDIYYNTDMDKPDFVDTVLMEDREIWDRCHADVTSPRIHALAVDWLEKLKDKPFFLFLHMWDVHYDFIPPPPYDTQFDPDYRGTISSRHFMHNKAIHPEMDPRDLQHIIALYDGEIAFTDHYLGLIMAKIRELGLMENTLFIIAADHGEEFFEHGNKGHRITLYDETVKIPLILKLPGKDLGGEQISNQVSIIDIAPTILNALKIPAPEQMQGRSLLPLALGKGAPDDGLAFLELGSVLKGLRNNASKLLYNNDYRQTIILDLAKDPKETHHHMVTDLPAWTRVNKAFYDRLGLDHELAEKYRQKQSGARVHLSEDQVNKLKSLGYIQ